MVKSVILKNCGPRGELLQATYLPEKGMNLISYKIDNLEVIDQSTQGLFDDHFAGLGALIGPHFYHRKKGEIPFDFDHSLFPHIKRLEAKGIEEPFSHGIARYVPWKYLQSSTQIQAKLKGSDSYLGTSLSKLEGQDFEIEYLATLLSHGLSICYKIKSERPSTIGFHYYYKISAGATLHAEVQEEYRFRDKWLSIPSAWKENSSHHLNFPLSEEADYGFIPKLKEKQSHDYHIILRTKEYSLHIDFATASSTEVSCQVYHPSNSSYVCIEPISAQDPQRPILDHHILEAKLAVFPKR